MYPIASTLLLLEDSLMLNSDLVVIGLGHAGCEAAHAAARLGLSVVGINLDFDHPARMSCNPSMGGPAKSTLLREVDALGGLAARVTDEAAVQVRTLNRGKGLSTWCLRAQCDRDEYSRVMRRHLAALPTLQLLQGEVTELVVEDGRVCGVTIRGGLTIKTRTVIITTGTFLGGIVHMGSHQRPAGRLGDPAATELAGNLRSLGLPVVRLKTGTPPRIDMRTVDFSQLEPEPGEVPRRPFSRFSEFRDIPPLNCHLVRTTAETAQLIRENLDKTALYSGQITGRGPRYCPSIEDKITRFPKRESHRLFLEPDGLNTYEGYLAGFSTSFPMDLQTRLLQTLPGFAEARIMMPGYAVEYDAFDPRQLTPALESMKIKGLYLAGQVNGTSGYEEAAAQGILAGINAGRSLTGRGLFLPARHEAAMGVMVSDLRLLGAAEPYRMFPSRMEHRLSLREDNAHLRLHNWSLEAGLLSAEEQQSLQETAERMKQLRNRLQTVRIKPGSAEENGLQEQGITAGIGQNLETILRRPETTVAEILAVLPGESISGEDAIQLAIEVKYEGFIRKEAKELEELQKLQDLRIPADLDWSQLGNVSSEAREKLAANPPATVADARSVPGVRAADLLALAIYLKKNTGVPPRTPPGN